MRPMIFLLILICLPTDSDLGAQAVKPTQPSLSLIEFVERLEHQQTPVLHLLRRVNSKLEDLRPWLAWRNGMIAALEDHQKNAGTQATRRLLLAPNPLPSWKPVHGKVQFVSPDGDVVVELRSDRGSYVVLRNWPARAAAVTGTEVKVLAKPVGTAAASTVLGAGRTLLIYDYGTPLAAEEVAEMMKSESELAAHAQAAQKSAASEAELKRKAETAERLEKFRAERAAKEAQPRPDAPK